MCCNEYIEGPFWYNVSKYNMDESLSLVSFLCLKMGSNILVCIWLYNDICQRMIHDECFHDPSFQNRFVLGHCVYWNVPDNKLSCTRLILGCMICCCRLLVPIMIEQLASSTVVSVHQFFWHLHMFIYIYISLQIIAYYSTMPYSIESAPTLVVWLI